MTRRKRPSKGELNKIIDIIFHPHFEKFPILILVDGVAHGLIEQDAKKSLPKFLRYSAPLIFKEIMREQKPPAREMREKRVQQ